MNSLRSNILLFYETKDIKIFQSLKFNKTKYINIVEILDYWRHFYKDLTL